jgi:ABC-type molybdate transport system ATPase subunit
MIQGKSKNVEMAMEGNILVIKVDMTKDFGKSGSGKNTIIATTAGNIDVPGFVAKIGLNIYKPI